VIWLTALAVSMGSTTVGAPTTLAGACPVAIPQADETVVLDPADFVEGIDNPYLPFEAGARWVYRESGPDGGTAKVRIVVLDETRVVQGVAATVVSDIVSDHGVPIEKTRDWYAQDVCGNVWYLGERTREFEDGHVVSRAGSWEAGVDGASAGVVMLADPQVGDTYREEYLDGEAEDRAEAIRLEERAQVPAGSFRHTAVTRNWTPLHPRIVEYKWFEPGVGLVLALGVSGGAEREELLRYIPPA
jgi:hypothetical protein